MIKFNQYYVASISLVVAVIIFTHDSHAESRRDSDIQSIDFKNFAYPASDVAAEITKKKSIRVQNGEYKNFKDDEFREDSFSFSVESVSYGDITGDGKEEAVVDTSLTWMGGVQQDESRIYVYTMTEGKPKLVLVPDIANQIDRDFSRYNKSNDPCEDGVFTFSAIASKGGLLKVDAVLGNPHACYDERKGYPMASMSYRISDNRWILVEPPTFWRQK